MAIITWNEELSVGIESIDNQHKKLIDLVNAFYDSITEASSKVKILELIQELKKYTVYHFSTEEKYMKEYDFAYYEAHKKEHDAFVKTVLDFEERYKTGKLILSLEITGFIKDWIKKHILGTDKKYTPLLKSKGVI
jgi:hemerythrin